MWTRSRNRRTSLAALPTTIICGCVAPSQPQFPTCHSESATKNLAAISVKLPFLPLCRNPYERPQRTRGRLECGTRSFPGRQDDKSNRGWEAGHGAQSQLVILSRSSNFRVWVPEIFSSLPCLKRDKRSLTSYSGLRDEASGRKQGQVLVSARE